MAGLQIVIDAEEVQKALAGTKKSIKSIQKGVLHIVGAEVAKALRGAIRTSDLKRNTGELLKCYRYKVKKDGSQVNIYPAQAKGSYVSTTWGTLKGEKGSHIFPKVYTLNYGYKNHKPRAFIEKGFNTAEKSNYDEKIQQFINKELQKYWG